MSLDIITELEIQDEERKQRKIEAADKVIATKNKKASLHASSVKILEEIRQEFSRGEEWTKRILPQLTAAYRALGQKGTPKKSVLVNTLSSLLAANTAVVDDYVEDEGDESRINDSGDEEV